MSPTPYDTIFVAAVEMHRVGQSQGDVISQQLSALLFHVANAIGRSTKGIEAIESSALALALTYHEVLIESAQKALEEGLNGDNN